MKKLMIIALTVCMFVLTGCSSEKKPEQDPQVDDGPAVVDEKPAEFIVINNDSYDELVAILNDKNLYKPDEFYKGEFSNQNGLSGYQYEWAKSSVNGKEFTLGNTVYHLTGEVKGGSSRIRFEAEEATFYLAKDNEGYGSSTNDKRKNDKHRDHAIIELVILKHSCRNSSFDTIIRNINNGTSWVAKHATSSAKFSRLCSIHYHFLTENPSFLSDSDGLFLSVFNDNVHR